MKKIGIVAVCIAVVVGVVWMGIGENIKILATSLNSFKDENLAHTFQHTPEIQPTEKISRGERNFQFLKENNIALADGFYFKDEYYPAEKFIEDTKTSALLVIKDDVIKHEKYYFGGE